MDDEDEGGEENGEDEEDEEDEEDKEDKEEGSCNTCTESRQGAISAETGSTFKTNITESCFLLFQKQFYKENNVLRHSFLFSELFVATTSDITWHFLFF